uniref:Uncharacterized protein n=1 Tax=Rhizophora mucronata TaxID=61149 RepID=A0A2P2N955_RHIMU
MQLQVVHIFCHSTFVTYTKQ